MDVTTEELDALRPVERKLIDYIQRGEVLDLGDNQSATARLSRRRGPAGVVRASVIRDVLRGRLAPDPDPHGLRLRAARITGRLDLDGITSTVRLELYGCFLEWGLTAADATLPGLVLAGCHLQHPDQALHAPRLTTSLLDLRQAFILATNDPYGTVTLSGRERRAVQLVGADLGFLNCAGAELRNESGPALDADGLRVDQRVFLNHGFEAIGGGEQGAVRLVGAHLGFLNCAGAKLRNESGPALDADGLRVDQDVALDRKFEATGNDRRGAVRLVDAHLGLLDCAGAELRNESGPALQADGLRVDQGVFLSRDHELEKDFVAVGGGERGAVRLVGAHLGFLDCAGAKLRNESGPALTADHLHVSQGMLLHRRFEAVGAGEVGAVQLGGAHVGQLFCADARLRNESGPALIAEDLRVDQIMSLTGGLEAVGAGDGVVVDLTRVQVGGVLVFDPARLEHRSDPHALLSVDGLVYPGLPRGIGPDGWLALIQEGTPTYAAQPYQQLAVAHRAAGHDEQARRVLRLQRHDQIHRKALTGRAERVWARFTGLTLGYGYQPWRALIGLLAVLITAVLLAVLVGGQGGLVQVHNPSPPTPLACPVIERVGVGLELGTPLIMTGTRGRCEATTTPAGKTVTVTGWALRLLAWAFATLFIAGFTSAVRKT